MARMYSLIGLAGRMCRCWCDSLALEVGTGVVTTYQREGYLSGFRIDGDKGCVEQFKTHPEPLYIVLGALFVPVEAVGAEGAHWSTTWGCLSHSSSR